MVINQKKALEMLWKGTCNVIVRQEVINPINKRTEFNEVVVYSNRPCKLSFERLTTTTENNNAALVTQGVKLFLSPAVDIPPGSKITVTQNGQITDYERSGEPAVYGNHQEVPLELFKGWA